VEELCDSVLQRLSNDATPDDVLTSLEDAFSQCSEEFETLALGATEVLIRHVLQRLEIPLSKLFTEKVWWADEEYFQSGVLDELDDLCSHFAPNIEPNICATHFMRETSKATIRSYMRIAFKGLKPNNNSMPLARVTERMRSDRHAFADYCDTCNRWGVSDAAQTQLAKLDLVIEFLAADCDFLSIHVKNVQSTSVFRILSDGFGTTYCIH
jgi:hypothetical protein